MGYGLSRETWGPRVLLIVNAWGSAEQTFDEFLVDLIAFLDRLLACCHVDGVLEVKRSHTLVGAVQQG